MPGPALSQTGLLGRYSLLTYFVDVSNADANSPGNMNFSPVGRAFVDPGGSPQDPWRFPPGADVRGFYDGQYYQFGNGPVMRYNARTNTLTPVAQQGGGQQPAPRTQWQPGAPANGPPVIQSTVTPAPQAPSVTLGPPQPYTPPVQRRQTLTDLTDQLREHLRQKGFLEGRIRDQGDAIGGAREVLAGIPNNNTQARANQLLVIQDLESSREDNRVGCDRHSQSARVSYAAWNAGHSFAAIALVLG